MTGKIKYTLVRFPFHGKHFQILDQYNLDHCLDYLRQVIMCHSDVTPITHAARPKPFNSALSDWRPNFAVAHTCRNFQKIHDWAAKFNTSGFVIESWPGLDPVADLRAKPVGQM